MLDISGRFAIREDFDSRAYRLSVIAWISTESSSNNFIQLAILIPKEHLQPKPDPYESVIHFAGLGPTPPKETP